tara:strand:- start:663 stop:1034 length:372 start_codon:yes stop_codon:yes gene_type:complete
MGVSRLSKVALDKILSGELKEPATCVIKFYMNTCPMCKNLSTYYHDISMEEEYSNLHFFAFNMEDDPELPQLLKFTGVPTISLVKVSGRKTEPKIRIMPEPDDPNDETWYLAGDIKDFIEKEK